MKLRRMTKQFLVNLPKTNKELNLLKLLNVFQEKLYITSKESNANSIDETHMLKKNVIDDG